MDTQELEKLYSLKEKGIITEEQFNLKKQQILGSDKTVKKEKVKKENIGTKQLFFYFVSVLSYLSLWGMFALSMPIFDYRVDYWENVVIIYTALLLLFMLFRFFSKKLHHKLISIGNSEKFIKTSKLYNKSMMVLTVLLLVVFIGMDIKCYSKNNGTEYRYYKNGQVKSKIQYKSGQPYGIMEEYYESGVIKSQKDCHGKFSVAHYVSGCSDNCREAKCSADYEVKEYYKNGKLAKIVQSEFGREKRIEYYESGKLKYTSLDNGYDEIFYSNDFFMIKNTIKSHSSSNWTAYDVLYIQCAYDGKLIDLNSAKDEKKAIKLCEEYSGKIKETN